LDLVIFTGVSLDFNTIIASIECTIVDINKKDYRFDYLQTIKLTGGAAISIASY
jgi:hypothetical protein